MCVSLCISLTLCDSVHLVLVLCVCVCCDVYIYHAPTLSPSICLLPEVTTGEVPQPAALFTSSPMVTKIKPLHFEGDSDREEDNSLYLSMMSEQNVSTHHNITMAQPDYLGDQTTHLATECSITDKLDISCDGVSKLDNQGTSVAKLPELDNFSNNAFESDICSDPVRFPLDQRKTLYFFSHFLLH